MGNLGIGNLGIGKLSTTAEIFQIPMGREGI